VIQADDPLPIYNRPPIQRLSVDVSPLLIVDGCQVIEAPGQPDIGYPKTLCLIQRFASRIFSFAVVALGLELNTAMNQLRPRGVRRRKQQSNDEAKHVYRMRRRPGAKRV
jgi:hypothetical protein